MALSQWPVTGIIILAFLTVMTGSCEPTAVESVRDNIFDPQNEEFIPAAPTNIRAGSDGTNVRVIWTINTEHADGYLIEKSINSTVDFQEIARAAPDEDRFIDESGRFGVPTLYRVTSFVIRDGVFKAHPTSPVGLQTRATFVVLPHEIAADGSGIEIHWRHFFQLHNGYLIEVKVDSAPGWELHTNYRHNVAEDNSYSYWYPLDGSEETIQFRVSPYFDTDDGYTIIAGYLFPIVSLP
ncbi:MAG: hypothetical protein LC662_11680 [Rhodothermaceae bacterium]|nr:hypothetical protein [Rhodothermaceae bacterium]